jgi:tRNA U55 pseudouridine synthase TruB
MWEKFQIRQAASSSQTQMGGYLRRMKGKLGKAEGTTAAAHKLARIAHGMIKSQKPTTQKRSVQAHPSERGAPPQSPGKTSCRPQHHPSPRRRLNST